MRSVPSAVVPNALARIGSTSLVDTSLRVVDAASYEVPSSVAVPE